MLNIQKQHNYAIYIARLVNKQPVLTTIFDVFDKLKAKKYTYGDIWLCSETVAELVLHDIYDKPAPDYINGHTIELCYHNPSVNPATEKGFQDLLNMNIQQALKCDMIDCRVTNLSDSVHNDAVFNKPFTALTVLLNIQDRQTNIYAPYGMHDLCNGHFEVSPRYSVGDGQELAKIQEIWLRRYPELDLSSPMKDTDMISCTDYIIPPFNDNNDNAKCIKLPCNLDDEVWVRWDDGMQGMPKSESFPYCKGTVIDFSHFRSHGFCAMITSDHFETRHIPFSEFNKKAFVAPKSGS